MSQVEELKVFVSERLQAAVSDVLGAFEKTLAGYEEQTSRLKDENNRYRSLLDVVLLSKLPQTKVGHANKSTPAAAAAAAAAASPVASNSTAERTSSSYAGHAIKSIPSAAASPVASDSSSAQTIKRTFIAHGHVNKSTLTASASLVASDSSSAQTAERPSCYSGDAQCLFTSHDNFFKLAANDNCPLCIKSVQATEKHLMKRHYRFAVHFNEGGTEKFVVPCFCTDNGQGRSHWHCPFCVKIIHRKCNFEVHLSKQHGDAILLQSQDAVSHQDCKHPELIQKGDSQMGGQSLEADSDQDSPVSIIYVNSFIQDLSEINCVQSTKGPPRPLDTQPDGWFGKTWQPDGDCQNTNGGGAVTENNSSHNTEESQSHTVCSNLKALGSKKKKNVKRTLPLSSLIKKESSGGSTFQNLTGRHSCKAHAKHTLKKHVQTHKVDKSHICEVCGKRLLSKVSLVHHRQSHPKRNQCGICKKVFSNNSNLQRHWRLHRPKGLNDMSSA
ncbi:uncharacterized protein [Paralichthys olivaceus]|uniref:uncharacterized protein isoform X4 n=1 Tax=Paralichthys olivaceus TaxID=8255 RepID=UPI003750F6C1